MAAVTVDFGKRLGRIKPLHGVNNGPVCYGGLVNVTGEYKTLAPPFVRLHDCNWPHPREVDIHTIFPDFSKDEHDPASYDFERTDTYLKTVLETGAKIVYRLGESIEHTPKKYYVHPPKDFEKWGRICLGVIRHYNEGWANGFTYDIKYWEIWNEAESAPNRPPETNAMWSGTQEQYLELYAVAARMIKKHDPTLKVGGPSSTMTQPDYNRKFLNHCRQHQAPLDFFSWHTYSANVEEMATRARGVRELLDEYGFQKTESHCNEWNYDAPNVRQPHPSASYPGARAERAKGTEGASYDAAVLLRFQDSPLDVACFYDGAPTAIYWGIFNCYGAPQKNYFALRAFAELYRLGEQVAATSDGGLYCGAAGKAREAAVMLSNFSPEPRTCELMLQGLAGPWKYEVLMVDHQRNLEPAGQGTVANGKMRLDMGAYSVGLVKLSAGKG